MLQRIIALIRQSLGSETYDYTEGSIHRAIGLLAIPMILELSLESIFAVVDIFFVSSLGDSAIATVGFTESLITIVYSLAIGLSTAATAMIARRVGEKKHTEASLTAYNVIVVAVLISVVLGGLGVIYTDSLLAFMGADQATIAMGSTFTKVMFGTNIVITLLFVINGIFRGAGNAAIAMRSLWIASILNIILDPIFIYGIGSWPGMGLTGAAVATVIGRSCGVGYQLYFLFKGDGVFEDIKTQSVISFSILKRLVLVAWPAAMQFIIASGSWIFITRLVASHGGITAAAGYQIAIRNVIFFILPAWGLSNAAATLVGQNLGAGKPERAEKSVWIAMKFNITFMAIISLLFLFFPQFVIGLYTKDAEIIAVGMLTLQVMGIGYIFYGIGMVMMQSINGAGDTRIPTLINVVGFWIIQIPLAYAVAAYTNWGLKGIISAIPIAETLMAIMAIVYFKTGRWKSVKV